ncbi:MAG TPA: DNA repair protein RadC [Gemmatimonadota bacterium]|jgi:DNA repair protein RadC
MPASAAAEVTRPRPFSMLPPELDARPRERCLQAGPEVLSTAELLALLVGTGGRHGSALALGTALQIQFPDLRELGRQSVGELAKCLGMGPARAAAIVAAFELGRRLARAEAHPRDEILTPPSAYAYLAPRLRDAREERFVALLLDTRSRVFREATISVGSLNASIVHPREVFRTAMAHGAAALLLAHNHPSGDPRPSREDRDLTRTLVEAGKLLDIPIYDHVVVGAEGYFSFREAGLIG